MPLDPSIGKAGIHAEFWFVSLLPCGDVGSLFLFFFFIGGAFLFLVILLLPLIFRRKQEHTAPLMEIIMDCEVSAVCSVFHTAQGCVQVCGWKTAS